MSFHTGYVQGLSNVGDLMDELAPIIEAHPAWERVHRAQSTDIYRCIGSLNDWDQDFFVSLGQTGYASTLRGYCFEDYDPATSGIRRPCVRGSVTHLCDEFDASLGGDTWHPPGNQYGIPAAGGSSPTTGAFATLNTVGLDVVEYWLSITNNRMILATRTGSTINSVYLGLFETFIPNNPNEFPLVAVRLDQTSTSTTVYTVGGWSRHPGREGIANRENFAVHPFSGTATDWTFTFGQVGGTTFDLFHGTPVGSRVLCRPLGAQATYGFMRGLLFDVIDIPASTGVAVGDTVVINGSTWAYLGANGNWVDAGV